MPNILVVDSDSPNKNAEYIAAGEPTTGNQYAYVLKRIRADVITTVIEPYEGDEIPDLSTFDGVVFTGSGVAWNTDDPRAEPLAAVMRATFKAGRPAIGSCNGMQLAASVLGGSTGESPNGREDGIAKGIHMTKAGKGHPMLAGRVDGYGVPCVHRDEVLQLPEGAVLLATNDHSEVQAFAYEKDGVDFWGMQYHPELSCETVANGMERWGRSTPEYLNNLRVAATDADAAKAVGTTPEEQTFETRTLELRNWLDRF